LLNILQQLEVKFHPKPKWHTNIQLVFSFHLACDWRLAVASSIRDNEILSGSNTSWSAFQETPSDVSSNQIESFKPVYDMLGEEITARHTDLF